MQIFVLNLWRRNNHELKTKLIISRIKRCTPNGESPQLRWCFYMNIPSKKIYQVVKRNVGWESDEYSIERCHMANCYRITLKHDDGREKDIYIEAADVYTWSVGLV